MCSWSCGFIDHRCNFSFFGKQRTVLETHLATGDGGSTLARYEYADEVQRISSRDHYRRFGAAGGLLTPCIAEALHRLRNGELLAEGTTDKSSTTNLAARLQATEHGR